jgi:hypothetical protein
MEWQKGALVRSFAALDISPINGNTPLCATSCALDRVFSLLELLQSPCAGACSRLRNFLHTTAQEVAHFSPYFGMKHLET